MSTRFSHRNKIPRWKWIVFWLCIPIIALYLFLFVGDENLASHNVWGVTFSKTYAEFLGLNWKDTYLATLDDLRVSNIRIPVYWNDVEPQKDSFKFDDYIFMLEEAEKRGVGVILVVGNKVPRWPECYAPSWTAKANSDEYNEQLLNLVKNEVETFKQFNVISMWQVENEPLVRFFGDCPPISHTLIKREVDVVRAIDDRPILITESGELSTWFGAARLGDVLGVTMYRKTWNPVFHYTTYPFVPLSYHRKAWLVQLFNPHLFRVIGSELQMEPWGGNLSLLETSVEDRAKTMNVEQFRKNIAFARLTGISEHYLWGVEWWAYQKAHNDDALWNEAKKLW